MRPRWEILADLINENHFTTIAEIGVSGGENAKNILKLCKLKKFHLVDSNIYNTFPMRQYDNNSITTFYEMTSRKACECVPDNLDLVFIDADHGYNSVLEDIDVWLPKVRNGGIISGHDYSDTHNVGVKLAVGEFFGDKINLEDDVLQNGEIKIWWTYVQHNQK